MKERKKRKKKNQGCPECHKKKPHSHKGCNEVSAQIRLYGR